MTSVALPGACAMRMRIGLLGYCCANAQLVASRKARNAGFMSSLFLLRLQHSLAKHLALFDEPESFVHFGERQLLVDDRLKLPLLDESQQLLEILAHEAVGAEHLDLEGPDVAQVFLRIEAGGGAA